MTLSSNIGGKILLHKVTPHKFEGQMMSAYFILVIGIDFLDRTKPKIIFNVCNLLLYLFLNDVLIYYLGYFICYFIK